MQEMHKMNIADCVDNNNNKNNNRIKRFIHYPSGSEILS